MPRRDTAYRYTYHGRTCQLHNGMIQFRDGHCITGRLSELRLAGTCDICGAPVQSDPELCDKCIAQCRRDIEALMDARHAQERRKKWGQAEEKRKEDGAELLYTHVISRHIIRKAVHE